MTASTDSEPSRHYRTWFWCVWIILFGLLTTLEVRRLMAALENGSGMAGWLSFWDMETTAPWFLLLILPLIAWEAHRNRRTSARSASRRRLSTEPSPLWRTIVCAAVVFSVALACSWQIGSRSVTTNIGWQTAQVAFSELPPAYHDEYSYLLQARTFVNGRLSWPPMTVRPDLFHQFHVLNEHRTMSRYFPWTGMWMAPFEAIGSPVWGHWLAGALSAAIFFLSLQQIVRQSVAFLGGFLIAVSPGIAVFSNLLLAHHPTMLALSVFTWAFFRMMKTCQLKHAFVAGIGLTLAMLARPMTAAGYGLPFGMWLIVQVVRSQSPRRLIFGFALPLLSGFAVLAVLNYEATGSWTRSAYQEYTERYTPRHRYGFNNAVGNAQSSGPPALHAYDKWATNLTPARAAENVWKRLVASLVWSLAIAPLVLGVLMTFPVLIDHRKLSAVNGQLQLCLLGTSVVSLHAAHVPYWFDGIQHWHYVFETAPLLLMLAAVGFTVSLEILQPIIGRKVAIAWLFVFIGAGLLPAWVALPPFNDVSKISAAVSELSFSRGRFRVFQQSVHGASIRKPALILVDETDADPQLSYIINPPNLEADVLVCRRPGTIAEIDELCKAFPDRNVYGFEPGSGRFSQQSELENAGPSSQ